MSPRPWPWTIQVALMRLPPGRLHLTPAEKPGAFTLRATSWVGSVVLPG